MATEVLILEAVNYALTLLGIREARSEKEKRLQRSFVEAFREALILTRAYIADRREGVTNVDRTKERELSLAWNKTGICGRDLESQGDFYAVYFEKSDFWSDPKGWELSNIKEMDISLERAEKEASKFLTTPN